LGEEKMENRPKMGDRAKNFSLQDQDKEEFELANFSGNRILLSFHPLAWTPVCSEQMKSLEENKRIFDSLDTIAVGVSIDTVPSKKAWADTLGIKHTRLLSDFWPHGKTATSYGIFREEDGFSERANILIDEDQRIAFLKIYQLGVLPDIREIIDTIRIKL
jgi:peroxiredoxin